jgi:hypothetical protein
VFPVIGGEALASEVEIPRKENLRIILYSPDLPIEETGSREDLVRRVLSSATFQKSSKLRAFLLYICRCALDNQPASATEQQIGIHVFQRSPGYNPGEDNIVRSQARLLRIKLEHHFAHEGKDEPVVITVPKGRYLPAFEPRFNQSAIRQPEPAVETLKGHRKKALPLLLWALVVVLVAIVWLADIALGPERSTATSFASSLAPNDARVVTSRSFGSDSVTGPSTSDIRITAGSAASPYVDVTGQRWESDQFYKGGISESGPKDIFPPVADPDLFKTVREGVSGEPSALPKLAGFRYDIPVKPGVYELRLFFADPARHEKVEPRQDTQNLRHFQINLNGEPLLSSFDAIADAGSAPVDIRAFKDVSPAPDGKVHLEFLPAAEQPFVNAIELTPGIPGKIKPIRLSAHQSGFVDDNGIRWEGDRYFSYGQTLAYLNSKTAPKVPALYTAERYGNFSYAIPVPPGSYTVRLHFLESFFGPSVPNGFCRGTGCRVFDVSCNGVSLLHDFDIFKVAGGAFRPVVRSFHDLRPNGQGKLLISFSPKVNYAEVRAIEVLDEAH